MVHQYCRIMRSPIQLAEKEISQNQLQRAKNQLRSNILMLLECRIVALEDLGRQILSQGYKQSIQHLCDQIEAVTSKQIKSVAQKLFTSSQPTLIAQGTDTTQLQAHYKKILSQLGIGK